MCEHEWKHVTNKEGFNLYRCDKEEDTYWVHLPEEENINEYANN